MTPCDDNVIVTLVEPRSHCHHRVSQSVECKFRQPAYLATSFDIDIANRFIRRSGLASHVRWVINIDPDRKCKHVNLVTKTVAGLQDEQEYLFVPYSAFKVVGVQRCNGTEEDPHVIELDAAVDNADADDAPFDLPLAPWS